MTELHKLIKLIKAVDDLERQAFAIFKNPNFSEIQQIFDLKSSLWSRISGEIDTERERLANAPILPDKQSQETTK